MAISRRIVCLANSTKYLGRCVAGKRLKTDGSIGAWIRPVSDSERGQLDRSTTLVDGREPRLLDIIRFPVSRAEPKHYQKENYLIDQGNWIYEGKFDPAQMEALCDSPETLWIDGSSSAGGMNDRVHLEDANDLDSSLYLIKPKELAILVEDHGPYGIKVRARFKVKASPYDLAITDPIAKKQFLAKGVGEYPLKRTYLCVSLGEPDTRNYCYKLVAAIITLS